MRFLVRILVVFFLVMVAVSAIRRLLSPLFEDAKATRGETTDRGRGDTRSTGRLVADPVCGTYIATSNAPQVTRGEETFYFCSEECRSRFQETA